MFEDFKREMERMKKFTFSLPIEADSEGFIDKECASEDCKYQFKVHNEDWSNIFKDAAVFCPMCGRSAPADSYWTTEQIEEAKEKAFEYVQGRIGMALESAARDFNRRQPKNSLLKISMQVRGNRPQGLMLPIGATEELKLKIQCEQCNSRFAVIGCGFFCPGCGYNSVDRLFQSSLQKISAKVRHVEVVRTAIAEVNADEADVTCRSLIESALSDCVVAFQRFSEHKYRSLTNAITPLPVNVFQRIDEGSAIWKAATGEGYENWLSPSELRELKLYFQRRHLLAHAEGIVDDKYIKNTGDPNYSVGQKLVVNIADVENALDLIKKVADKISEKA